MNFNNFTVLNSGSVCALYLLQVIIRTAFFCRAKTLLLLKPQHRITPKHDDVRDHNKPGARCIAGEMRGPAGEADGKQAVRNALAVV